jgi:hypothetical protein
MSQKLEATGQNCKYLKILHGQRREFVDIFSDRYLMLTTGNHQIKKQAGFG